MSLGGRVPRAVGPPQDPGSHRHHHRGFREGVPIEPTFREVADRALFRADAADSGEPGHRHPNGTARLDALEDARRIRETGSVPDGNVADPIDAGGELYVEKAGDRRGPPE